jgi:hypothetical protein
MAGGAGYNDYQAAYSKVRREKSSILPASAISDSTPVPIMVPGVSRQKDQKTKTEKREYGDVVRAVDKFLFLFCAGCGLKIKVPPEFNRKSFPCPRCKTEVTVPLAEIAAMSTVLETVSEGKKQVEKKYDLRYRRKSTEWESFKCTCGHTIQLSPHFSGDLMSCSNCGRKIKIDLPQAS